MVKKIIFLLILSTFLLQGCINSNLKAPDKVDIPANFTQDKLRGIKIKNQIDYWKKFNNHELNQIIDQAFNKNYDIKIAIKNLEAAKALVKQADTVLYPQIDLKGGAAKVNSDTGSENTTTDTFSISAPVNYELDIFGRIRSQKDITILKEKSDIENLKSIYITLTSDICELYYNIVAINSQIEIVEKNLDILSREKNTLIKRYESGVIDYTYILDTKKTISDLRSSISDLKRSKNLSISAVLLLAGDFKNQNYSFDTQSFPTLKYMMPQGIPLDIIKSRPDVKKSFIALEIKNKEVATAIAQRFPRLSFTAELSRSANNPDSGSSIYTTTWSIAGNFLAPMLDWGRRKAKVGQTKKEWEASFFAYQKTILAAFLEISDSLNNINSIESSLKHKNQSRSHINKKFEIKKLKYELGTISYLEFINAQKEELAPLADIVELKKAYVSSVIKLAKATGASWSDKYIKKNITQKKIQN